MFMAQIKLNFSKLGASSRPVSPRGEGTATHQAVMMGECFLLFPENVPEKVSNFFRRDRVYILFRFAKIFIVESFS
jgi:hypothetical protein